MICPFCNNNVKDEYDGITVGTVSCKNHKPAKIELSRDYNIILNKYDGDVTMKKIILPWNDSQDVYLTWYFKRFSIELVSVQAGFFDYETIILTNYHPKNITPENALEIAKRYLALRAFS